MLKSFLGTAKKRHENHLSQKSVLFIILGNGSKATVRSKTNLLSV